MDISVLYIIPNDRIIETVQRVMQRCDVNYPVCPELWKLRSG